MQDTVLFATTEEKVDRWAAELLRREPGLDLRIWPDVGKIEDITYAIVARPPKGELAKLPNLKAIFFDVGRSGRSPVRPATRSYTGRPYDGAGID